MIKQTRISEGKNIEFRAEALNAANHPYFPNPNMTVTAAQSVKDTGFGQISASTHEQLRPPAADEPAVLVLKVRQASWPVSFHYRGGRSLSAPFSLGRDPAPQESFIQVGTPNFGSTHRITAKYPAASSIKTNQSGIYFPRRIFSRLW